MAERGYRKANLQPARRFAAERLLMGLRRRPPARKRETQDAVRKHRHVARRAADS